MPHEIFHPDPSLARRAFLALLGGLGSLAIGGIGWPGRALAAPTRRRSLLGGAPDLASLVVADFEALEGATLRVQPAEGDAIQLRLIEVRELPARGPRPRGRVPFSILLEGPSDAPLAQDLYPISHPALGKHDLLVVPVVTRRSRPVYEVIFG